MPTDLSGSPTSLGIGTYNVDTDAPSGLGFNEAMAQIDALIAARVGKPAGVEAGDVPVWNGTAWVRPSGTPDATKFVRGDGSWAVPLSVIRGGVTAAGVVAKGTGFTVVRNSAGNYTVTFTVAFAAAPAVVVSSSGATGVLAAARSAGTSSVVLEAFNSSTLAALDADLDFIAMAV